MRAKVDKDICIGCGLCPSICPNVFQFDDEEGVAVAIDADIDEKDFDSAKEARDACPVEAIEIEE